MDKRLAIYLAISFGGSWVTWLVVGMLTGAITAGVNSSAAMIAVIALTMFFPLIGALVANASVPTDQRIELGLRPNLRSNGRLYALAWLLPSVLTVTGGVVFFLVLPHLFDANATQVRIALEAAGAPVDQLRLVIVGQLIASVTVGPLVNTVPSLGEEVGWRGMLFPLLCERMSERRAALVSGAIWGLWHAPIIAMGHNYGMSYPGFPVVGILTMTVACTSIGCLLSWLRLRSDSVWSCAVAHGAINAIANAAILFCTVGATPAGPSPLGYVAGIPTMVLAVACWYRLSAKEPTVLHG